jgi:hypothetical protein
MKPHVLRIGLMVQMRLSSRYTEGAGRAFTPFVLQYGYDCDPVQEIACDNL